MNEYYLG